MRMTLIIYCKRTGGPRRLRPVMKIRVHVLDKDWKGSITMRQNSMLTWDPCHGCVVGSSLQLPLIYVALIAEKKMSMKERFQP